MLSVEDFIEMKYKFFFFFFFLGKEASGGRGQPLLQEPRFGSAPTPYSMLLVFKIIKMV